MRIDVYTKTILTLIALLLAVIALKPILQPQAAMAEGSFPGLQFSYSGDTHAFFNVNTGMSTRATFGNMVIMETFATTTNSAS